jgi:hypothetical protein
VENRSAVALPELVRMKIQIKIEKAPGSILKKRSKISRTFNPGTYCSCQQNAWRRPEDPNIYYNYSYFIAPLTS